MNYTEAVEYIHNCSHVDGHAGMKRILPLTEKLGSPQKKMKFIHIAGSSGKGSTAAMTEAVLRKAGYKTGLFMSPYVYDFRERLQINGQLPDGQLIADVLETMLPALDEMKAEGRECTEFETLTALAFVLFAREECDFVVLEVGIGGKNDCTNVIDPPVVACITNIGLDHTNMLGDTITDIAKAKCGIIKKGSRVAAYCDLNPEAKVVLYDVTSRYGITPNVVDINAVKDINCTGSGSSFAYKKHIYNVSMIGLHQVKNALNVIGICEELNKAGIFISDDKVADGIKEVSLVGRLQIVKNNPTCILDGAHNPDKIASVCDAIDNFYSEKNTISVFGMQRKKDYMRCIPEIAKRSTVFIATEPNEVKDALTAEEIGDIASSFCSNVLCCKNPVLAGKLALGISEEDDLILACGSLYLISDVRKGVCT